jgi:hypothetical protein
VLSAEFRVYSGVRQRGILSPVLFNLYGDDLIKTLKDSWYDCYFSKIFVGCIICRQMICSYGPALLLAFRRC